MNMPDRIEGFDPVGKPAHGIDVTTWEGVMQLIFEAVVSRQIFISGLQRDTTPTENYTIVHRLMHEIFTTQAEEVWKSYAIKAPVFSIKIAPPRNYLARLGVLVKHLWSTTIVK
jgi:hypothetical protein